MSIRILDADPGMLEQLEKLEQSCFSVPWTRDQILGQMPDPQHVFLVAVDNDQIVGYVGMMHVLDEGYISNVAVCPERRRQGIADQLLKHLILRAKELDLSFVTLEVREGNSAAVNLYAKHTFEPVGMRKNYYDRPRENAILMTMFLERTES